MRISNDRIQSPNITSNNILVPLSLFIVSIISRIPFTSKFLYNMDSVQFALALEKYDITLHQPHPPGYFLYVMLGRLLNLFIRDANTVFVSISVIFSGLMVVAIYYLGKELFDRKTGFLASVIALTSPSIWFYGEVALSYIVEAFFSTVIALLCWRIYKGEHKNLWLSVAILGIAGGIRQNTMVFLLPLWLFSVKGLPVRRIIVSLILLTLVCLLWVVPMVWMTGGLKAYHEAFREYWLFTVGHVSVFEKGWTSFKIFSLTLVNFIYYGIGAGIFVLSLTAYSLIRKRRLKYLDRKKVYFSLFWTLPPVFFYLMIFIHPVNPGYALIFLPALFVLTAISIRYIGAELKQVIGKDISILSALAIIMINVSFFFFSNYQVTNREIRNHDLKLSIMLDGIKTFDHLKTAVFVEPYMFFGYRHIMYYLPEYWVYQINIGTAPTGEMRKTFWGVNKKTFLSDEVILPENINDFIIPAFSENIDKLSRFKGIKIRSLSSRIFIVSGPVDLISHIYPQLKVRLQDNNKDIKHE